MSDLLGQLPQPLLLVVAALLVTAETAFVIGLVLPGTSLLLTLGLFAHLGAITPMAATVTAVAAAVGGGQLAYLLGRRRGHLRSISPLTTLVPDSAWSHVVALLTRHGRRTVVIGQWLGGSRPLAAFDLRRY